MIMIIYVVERKYNCVLQYGATLSREKAMETIKELEKRCREKHWNIYDYTGACGFYIREYEISTESFTGFD